MVFEIMPLPKDSDELYRLETRIHPDGSRTYRAFCTREGCGLEWWGESAVADVRNHLTVVHHFEFLAPALPKDKAA